MSRSAFTTASHNRPSPASAVKAFPPASSSSDTRITTGSCHRRRPCLPRLMLKGSCRGSTIHIMLTRAARSRLERLLRRLSEASTGRRWVLGVHEAETVRFKGNADAGPHGLAGGTCVGRWPSGASLALAPRADDPQLRDRNDFFYRDDPDGLACPLGAHVRRTNPRDDIKPYPAAQSLSMSEAHRLLRRARVFGPTLFDPKDLADATSDACRTALLALTEDGRARGIHFFCVNASIRSQFEFVQQTWCNNPRFGGLNENKDPISGDNNRQDEPSSHMTIPAQPLDCAPPRCRGS